MINFDKSQHKVLLIHLIYSTIEGVIRGVFILNEFVLIKSLHGSNYQIGFLLQFQHVVLIFAIFFNEFFKRQKKKNKVILKIAILTRLPLIALFFFPTATSNLSPIYHIIFLTVFLLYYLANPLIFPIINLLLKNNYTHDNFGKYYGYATSVNKIVMLVTTFIFGYWLDISPNIFRYVYPIMGILGILSIYMLTKIKYVPEVINDKFTKLKISKSLLNTIRNMWAIIKSNKPFRDFEIGFMFYGFAFLSSAAVITIFFERELHLNYFSVATYKNVYNILAILILPFFGKLLNKIDPRIFAIYTFGSLMLFTAFLGLTYYINGYVIFGEFKMYYSLAIAYIFYGVFAATMALLWNIGSAYFSHNQNAGEYQSVHLTLTGFRALFAPLIGVAIYEWLGYFMTFTVDVIALLIGILIMLWSKQKHTISIQ